MWRERAVRSILVEDVAGLRPRAPAAQGDPDPGNADSAAAGERALAKAVRRSVIVVALDWIAIAILFVVRDLDFRFLDLGPTEDAIFTLGVLAVAAHSGFRLGQLEKLRAVARACRELAERT